jgi:hypothetical protein
VKSKHVFAKFFKLFLRARKEPKMYDIGTIGYSIAMRQPKVFDQLLTRYGLIRKVIAPSRREIDRMMRTNNRYDHTLMM